MFCQIKQLPGLDIVLEMLIKAATSYAKAYRKIPMLFINGVDLLKKETQISVVY